MKVENRRRSECGTYAIADLLGGLATGKLHLGSVQLKTNNPLSDLVAEVKMSTLVELIKDGELSGEYERCDYNIVVSMTKLLADWDKESDFFTYLQEWFVAEVCGEHIPVVEPVEPVEVDPALLDDILGV